MKDLKAKLYILYYAYKDPRVSWYLKLFILLILGYALSPIDLIPDFIPILGYLDDFLLLPVGIILALTVLPNNFYQEFEKDVELSMDNIDNQVSRIGGISVIAIWIIGILSIIIIMLR